MTAEKEATEQPSESAIMVSLKPEILFSIGPLPITNSMLSSTAVVVLLIVVIGLVSRRLQTVPGKLQLLFETLIAGGYDFVQGVTHNETLTKRIFPFFMTLMLFFLTANLMNFLPGLLAVEFNGHHLYRPAVADYALVFGLTVMMFVVAQTTVIRFIGLKVYLKKYINFSSPVNFFVGLLELVGEFARIISLSFRLFGNIFSEEVLMLVMLSLAPFIAPVPFALLGLLTSIIQALLFPMLILLFVNVAVEEGKVQAT